MVSCYAHVFVRLIVTDRDFSLAICLHAHH